MRYRAWTFDPAALHRWLDPQLVLGGEFSSLLLRDVAMEVAARDDPTVVEYVACFGLSRDDEEAWDEAFHDWVSDHWADWYVVAMAGHMTPCPRPSMATYDRLQWLLPMARIGWNAFRTGTLLNGLPLRWLVEDYADQRLHTAFGRDLRTVASSSGGGWLPVELAKAYRGQLDQPPRGVPETDLPAFQESVDEIKAMLDVAIERGAALRMVVDL